MKQTVEEAAKEARMASAETLTTYGTHTSLDDFTYLSHDEIAEAAFIKGAEWQAKQSPWISVKEQLPEKDGKRLWLYSASGTLHVMMHGDTEDNPIPDFTQYGGSNIENSVTIIDGILNDGGDW